jgi:DHA3 family macrolide efflux protein-like MFS transporter
MQENIRTGVRSFVLISIGQIISALGTGLTNFGLGVWILQKTGSATSFGFIILAVMLPPLLITPFAGVLVDRYDRKWLMMLADAGSGLCTVGLAFLAWNGHLNFWWSAALLGASACFSTLHMLAYTAATTLLIEKQHLGRASGVIQMGSSLATVLSPALGGALVLTVGINGVLAIDFITYFFAVLMTALSVIPKPVAKTPATAEEEPESITKQALWGLRYLQLRPGLLTLTLYLAGINFVLLMANVLKPPLLLSFASPAGLGTLLSIESVGFLVGSLLLSTWGGPKRLVLGILATAAVQAVGLMMVGVRPSLYWAGAGLLIAGVALPIMNGCNRVLLQRKTPPELQGRIFATAQLLSQGLAPFAAISAGPLADRIFEPLLSHGGRWATTLGPWIGSGRGRGMGFLLVLMGLGMIVGTAIAALFSALHNVEMELPDVDLEPAPGGTNEEFSGAPHLGTPFSERMES